jgi:hypothetical protein
VVAFFAPWVDWFGYVQQSGFDLATSGSGWKRHLLWLYPLAGAALAAAGWRGDARTRNLAFLVGGAVIGLAIYDVADGMAESLRYGAWITVGGAVVALATGLLRGDRGWSAIGGALVLIGFFLPWLGALSGWDLAHLDAAPDPLPSPKWLYLVPALGMIAAASSVSPRGRLASALAGAGVLALLGYLYFRTATATVGWGAWLTLAAGATALVGGVLLAPRRSAPIVAGMAPARGKRDPA